MEKQIGNTTIRLVQGDICDCATDAIVNAANNRLWMGAGVAGAIRRRGGAEIEKEAVAKGPIPVGEAAVTGAGALPAKFVIHAAAMGADLVTDETKIRSATASSLHRAEELDLKSIAFPALGTGVGGFSMLRAAEIMLGAVAQHCRGSTSLAEVIFCLFDTNALASFESALEQL